MGQGREIRPLFCPVKTMEKKELIIQIIKIVIGVIYGTLILIALY
jgi:hypothetical protein